MIATDAVAFLRSTPPFHALPQALFDEAARSLDVAEVPAGTWLARAGGDPLRHLWVIRGGTVRLERDGRILQILEEGESFGYTSLLSGAATMDVMVEEALVACRIPGAEFLRLLADATFAAHFALELSERLRASLADSPVASLRSDLGGDVGEMVHRSPVWVEPDATVGQVARVMRDERISSVLVRSDPPGILTDRDLRNRVLAEGLGPDTPVAGVYTRGLRTVAGATPVHAAWTSMLDEGIHHLAVTSGAKIVGVLTSSDLLRSSQQGPVALIRQVERLAGRESLPGYGKMVAEMTAMLLAGGLDASHIAGFVARLNDALLARILEWAEAELGPPPAPYAWIVCGSEGRMEQTLLTDQDNALVYDDAGADRREWYQALAERANADLQAAGFPLCPGGYMARSWNGPVSEWAHRFSGWIDVPNPQALLVAAIFFDFRTVGGSLDLEPLHQVVARASQRPVFLRFLAQAAMGFHPPPLLLLRLRGASSVVDLKAHGIAPVVFLARCYALEAGSRARSTVERIEAAVRAGMLEGDVAAHVTDAYRFLLGLRLRRQIALLAEGKSPTNSVALSELTAVERSRLKEAFRVIKSWQELTAHRYQTDF
jgi:CBS domain-containing protein